MNDENVSSVHWSFWAVGIVALIWNVLGVINFFAQMNPDVLAAYRESERAIVEGRPAWATAAFAIAVFGGALGAPDRVFEARREQGLDPLRTWER
jgi:Na+/proline symporter